MTSISDGEAGSSVRTKLNAALAAVDALGSTYAAIADAYSAEKARDDVGAALTGGAGITVTVNDGGDTITIAAVSNAAPRLAGNWYIPGSHSGTLAAGIAAVANTIYYIPFVLERAITASDLGVRITTLAAGGNIKLAVYANDPATNRPTGTPIAETASISTASAVNVSADITGSNVTLDAGVIYWSAFWADGTAGGTVVLQAVALANASAFSRYIGGTQDQISTGAGSAISYVQSSETYGTWPDAASETLTVTSAANRNYCIQLKAA